MITNRRNLIVGGAAMLAATSVPRLTFAQSKPIKIGVLSDMSGPFSADTGPGSAAAAQLAIEDYAKINPNLKVELVSGDMQSKADLCASIASSWYEWEGVDLVIDVPLSSGALAIAGLAQKMNKAAIFTGPGSSDITGKSCGPNHVHWVYDTYSNARSTARSLIAQGKKRWFFIQADYAFGANLVRDTTQEIAQASGEVVGVVKHPSPNTSDFSSFLLQAQAANPDVLALANSSAETSSCLKQAVEFGLSGSGITMAALQFAISQTHALGLETAQGLNVSEAYYWNTNEGTRAFADRWEKLMPGARPNQLQAGVYSGIIHYLKAVDAMGVDAAKADGKAAVAKMKEIPTDDPLFGKGVVRADGRKIHNYYLFQVKTPAESKEPWDYYNTISTLSGDDAFRPLNSGSCPMIKA